jgi:glycosyltransferase involved in cell wall biosynthesis
MRWKIAETLFGNDPRLEAFLKRQKVDFVYPYFTRYDAQKSFRSAAWISDVQHKCLPQFFTKEEIQERDRLFLRIARHASTVILSSKAAKADFQKFFPEAAEKSKVLPFRTYPVSAWYEPDSRQTQQEYSLSDRFFLVSNQFWQHKNHLVLFKALKILKDKSIYPIVVCTGHIYDRRKLDYTDMVLQTIHKFGLARQVYLLGLIPRIEQVQLMRCSLAVVQPSLFEGWSTVVEDARCLGKKIFLSDLPVHREQNPPNCVFFDRNSPENLAHLLADWWDQLSPGPDQEQEAISRERSLREAQAFGHRFLEIVGDESFVDK